MKKLILALVVAGCSISIQAATHELTNNYDLPADLSDCKIYKLTDGVLNPVLYITKCPLSKTSTTKKLSKYEPVTTILEDSESNAQPEPKIIQMNGKRYMEIK